jgi:hypothetical protein
MALIEDDDDMPIENLMPVIFTHKSIEFLNGRDDDMSIRVFELLLQF